MPEPIPCRVCGERVDPATDVLFGTLGRPMFAAHSQPRAGQTVSCANMVREGANVVGKLASWALQRKAPRVWSALQMAKRALVEGTSIHD